jgi:hypothetical protein
MALLLAVVAAAYFLFSLAPVIWPALRAFPRRRALSRPWLFVGLVACVTYGLFSFFLFALMIPAQAYTIWLAPQFEEAGWPYGKHLVWTTRFLAEYWWIALPPLQLLVAFFVTRRFAAKWERICSSLAT